MLGWYPPEKVAEFKELSINGLKIYATPRMVKRLKGKELVLEPMEQRIPNAAGKPTRVLVYR